MTRLSLDISDYINPGPNNCVQGDNMNTEYVKMLVPQFTLDSVEIDEVPVTAYDLSNMFWEKLKLGTGDNQYCWLWQAETDKDGYGRWLNKDWDTRSCHRITYMTFNGPIPAGHEVHHLCEVKNCCNPNHLITCTPWEHAKLRKQLKE